VEKICSTLVRAALVALCATALFPFATAAEEPANATVGNKPLAIYICLDSAAPCIADTAEGCPNCPGGLKRENYALEPHMEALGMISNALKTAVRKGDYPAITRLGEMVALIAKRTPEFPAPKQTRDMDGYRKHAAELDAEAARLLDAAKAQDSGAAKDAFRALGATCASCHQQYR